MEYKINFMNYKTFKSNYPNWDEKENGNYINLPNEGFIVKISCYYYWLINNRKGRVFMKYCYSIKDCLLPFIR